MQSDPPTPEPTQQELAVERTVMAHERTLMAWLRTALAMISFGFTLRQFFDLLEKESRHPLSLFGPRSYYGLVMMGTGILMLALASLQHAKTMRRFRQRGHKTRSLTLVFAIVCLLVGAFALFATVYEMRAG
ncbi:MAG: DUF202 domain-containing protein [Myxococcales bacterium]